MTEDKLHEAVAQFLTQAIGPAGEDCRGVCWFSVEHRNARSPVEGAKRKARGVCAGIPDVMLFHDGMTTAVELKRPAEPRQRKGTASAAQIAMHRALRGAGVEAQIVRSLAELELVLTTRGIPVRARVAA